MLFDKRLCRPIEVDGTARAKIIVLGARSRRWDLRLKRQWCIGQITRALQSALRSDQAGHLLRRATCFLIRDTVVPLPMRGKVEARSLQIRESRAVRAEGCRGTESEMAFREGFQAAQKAGVRPVHEGTNGLLRGPLARR